MVAFGKNPFGEVNGSKQLKRCYTGLDLSVTFGWILTPSCEESNQITEVKGRSYEKGLLHNTNFPEKLPSLLFFITSCTK